MVVGLKVTICTCILSYASSVTMTIQVVLPSCKSCAALKPAALKSQSQSYNIYCVKTDR